MTFETHVAQAVEQMRSQGFTIIEGLISEERLIQAGRDAEPLFEKSPLQKDGPNGPIYGRLCKGLFKKTRAFDDLYSIPLVLAIVEAVLIWKSEKDSPAAFNFVMPSALMFNAALTSRSCR